MDEQLLQSDYPIAEAKTYANQMLYFPSLPDTYAEQKAVWPEVSELSRIYASSFTGEPHKEIRVVQTCRRGKADLTLAVHYAISQFRNRMEDELKDAGDDSKVEWRVRPEVDVHEISRVVRYHEDGPDRDFMTDKRCTLDHRFWVVKVYARCSFVPAKYLVARRRQIENSGLAAHG